MKFFLCVLILFIFSSINAKDYIWKSDGKRTLITEHKYSDNSNFRGYKIKGTFSDNMGNYGEWNTYVFAVLSNSKISKLEFSSEFTYQNNKKIFFQGYRGQGSDEDAGVGKSILIAGDKELEALIDTKCTYSIKFFNESTFGVNKCNLSEEQFLLLKNMNEN